MKFRKIVSTALIASMLFFAPSLIPIKVANSAALIPPCGFVSGWLLPTDTAFASAIITPCPVGHAHTPVWPWVIIGCAGSIVVSALAANFFSNRALTTPEAWTCGLLYWVPMQYPQQPANKHH